MMIWLAKHQQTIKWLVYALLLVNFGMYIIEDIGKFQRALSQGQSLLAATTRLATSLDLVGWFALLAIFLADMNGGVSCPITKLLLQQ